MSKNIKNIYAYKIVGILTLISSVSWIIFRLAMIVTSLTVVDGFQKNILAENTNIKTQLVELRQQTILGWSPKIWTDTIDTVDNSMQSAFTKVLSGLHFLKIVLLVLPSMIILSQVLPLYSSIEMIR